MRNGAVEASERLGRRLQAGARRWAYSGTGIPRSRDGIRFGYVAVVLIGALTVWGYLDVSARGRIEAGNIEAHRTDFTVFTEAGAAFFDGRDPYRVTNPRGWFYLYPPLFALLVSPLAILDSQSQVVVWYALSVTLGFGCFCESRRLWRLLAASGAGPNAPGVKGTDVSVWIGAPVGMAVILPALDCLQRGQLGIALVYPLLLGFRLDLSGRSRLASLLGGVVLAWPAVVKLVPAVPVAFLLLTRWAAALAPRRAPSSAGRAAALTLGVVLGGFFFVLAIPAACVGWGENLLHLRTWARKVATSPDMGQEAKFHLDSVSNQSLGNAAHLLAATLRRSAADKTAGMHWLAVDRAIAARRRADYTTRSVVQVARALVLVLLTAVALRVSLRLDELGQAATYGLACLAPLLVSPLAWGHYYVLALPAVLCVPLWLVRRGHHFAAKAVAVGLPALTWMHYGLMSWFGPIGLLGLGTTVWFLAVCAVALRVRAPFIDDNANLPTGMRADVRHDLVVGTHEPLRVPQPASPADGGWPGSN